MDTRSYLLPEPWTHFSGLRFTYVTDAGLRLVSWRALSSSVPTPHQAPGTAVGRGRPTCRPFLVGNPPLLGRRDEAGRLGSKDKSIY